MATTQGRYRRAPHLSLIESEFFRLLSDPEVDTLLVKAPPRHGKTELISKTIPVWYHSVYPERRSILTSYAISLARKSSRYVRDRVHELAPIFGHAGVSDQAAGATDWEMENGIGGMLAAGIGGGIVGRAADLFIVDDYLKNAEQALSSKIRDSQWDWYQTVANTRLEPGAKTIVLATQWHAEDLIGRIEKWEQEEQSGRIRTVRLPALAEPSEQEPDPMGRQTGEALWPERFTAADLARKRDRMEPYWWDALYQQRPGTYGSNEWPAEYFAGIFAEEDEWPATFTLSASALDPSKGKDAKKGDPSANVFVGWHGGRFWVDAQIDVRPVPRMIAEFVAFNRYYRPAIVGIEAVAFQELLGNIYKEAMTMAAGYADDPELLQNTVAKAIRISRLGKWLHQRKVKIRRTAGGQKLVAQMREFPNGEHDDGPDAFEMALRLLFRLIDAMEGMSEVVESDIF